VFTIPVSKGTLESRRFRTFEVVAFEGRGTRSAQKRGGDLHWNTVLPFSEEPSIAALCVYRICTPMRVCWLSYLKSANHAHHASVGINFFSIPARTLYFDYQSQISSHRLPFNSTGPSHFPNLAGPVPASGKQIQSLTHPGISCLL
jgi:hypothetical protein